MTNRDWFTIVFIGSIWGSSFLLLIRELGPLWVSAGRVGIGAMGSWVLVLALRRPITFNRKLLTGFFVLGAFTYAIPFALFPLAQGSLASGVVAVINAMTPITTVVVSHFWLGGEKASWSKLIGVGAGLGGVAVLTLPVLSAGGVSQLWAVGASLLATLCYAVALNYTRSFRHIDPLYLAAGALSGATLAAVPTAFLAEGIPQLVTVEGWAALLAIALISTTFAFALMYRILPRVGATNFATVTFIAPISAIILGYVFLGESLQVEHFMGMIGIFAGLVLIDGRLLNTLKRVAFKH
ncbi:MAG: DMT family transporter [Alphaproteobacteria bacterium]|nr:DMT family transporter [Alphaproteobacteria bacterium]